MQSPLSMLTLAVMMAWPAAGTASLSLDLEDPAAVSQQLSVMMEMANMKLGQAQRHHEKVVKKARSNLTEILSKEGAALGGAVAAYTGDYDDALARLEAALNESKAVLAEEDAKPSKPSDWNSPEVGFRSELFAQIGAAERALRQDQRRREFALQEARSTAKQQLEDGVFSLSRPLGDLSEVVDKAKADLDAKADAAPNRFMAQLANSTASNRTAKTVNASAAMTLQTQILKTTEKNTAAANAAAEKQLKVALALAGKQIAARASEIETSLQAAETKELKHVRDAAPAIKIAPASKKSVGKGVASKVAAKTAVAKKAATPTKPANEAAPTEKVAETTAKVAISVHVRAAAPAIKIAPASKK